MSRFRFRLQKVLDLRLWNEQEKAGQLRRAQHEAREAARALEHLTVVQSATRDQISAAHGAGGTAGHLQNLREVLHHLDAQVTDAKERQAEAEARVELSVSKYTEAFRERRILEELRERRAEESRIEENEAERKVLDEIALARHALSGAKSREVGP